MIKKLKEIYEKNYNSEGYLSTYYIPKGAMSTIGIISKKELQKIDYFNNFAVFTLCKPEYIKNRAMESFLSKLTFHNFVTEYPVFPYWKCDSTILLYCYDNFDKTPQKIKEQTFLSCVQFLNDTLEIDTDKTYFLYRDKI